MKKKLMMVCLTISCCLVMLLTAACGSKETLHVYNWGEYIDPEVIKLFEQEYDVKVKYDLFDANEDMYIKLKAGGNAYDVVFPSDYFVEKLIAEEMLLPIDFANVPNAALIDSYFQGLPYDAENKYSVPYLWGTLGIVYNSKYVTEPVDSWSVLWDEKYTGEVFMLNSPRDSIGCALKYLGYSFNSHSPQELAEAKEILIKQRPLVLAYMVEDMQNAMITEEGHLGLTWSGDFLLMERENPDLKYVLPKEGSNVWVDCMVIPKTCQNKELAEKFINFMCSTEIALKNANYTAQPTPHTGAKAMQPEEFRNNPAAYPRKDVLDNSEFFRDPGTFVEEYDKIWTEIKVN